MTRICVVDYGVGNIFSAIKGLKRFAEDVVLSEDPKELHEADALVLPGQGSFEAGMRGLTIRNLLGEVKMAAEKGKPILGICLGAQLLLEKGFEFGEWEGLGFLPGNVVRFPPLEHGTKTPHMGWNSIEIPSINPPPPGEGGAERQERGNQWKGTVLEGVAPGADMYFIHSYILQPKDRPHVLAETMYGGLTFASVIDRGAIVGCQFHPEKSGEAGLRILRNFVAMAQKS
ncbi:MAG: imidazole glycerol phosphate synthase subunit HisH [Candidatus Peribacteraceae bacterium]|nr:imidazole glycerol phosphate synthase subunit HisH [Candidatus Peribacteraceae bacterium]MDD5741911.1 imidazole glycerol phosphate synthase subunit HisH [Candidatus Peribacteraceae bacterium]